MRRSVLFAAALGLVATACASPGSTPAGDRASGSDRQCFYANEVDNFRANSARAVYIRVRPDQVYELSTGGACFDAENAFQLAILPGPGSSRLCTGDWATLVTPGAGRPASPCRVRVEKRLTPDEVAALPSRDRP